jgi:hypothetical protein
MCWWGVLEHQALMVHHTSLGFIRSSRQPTSGYNRLDNWQDLYIIWSSSRQVYRSYNRSTVDRLAHQLTTNWMHGQSSQRSLSSWLENVNLAESTLTTNDYRWTRSSQFHGSWLDIEAINSKHLGSLSSSDQVISYGDIKVQYALWCSDHNVFFLSVVTMSLDTTFCLRNFIPLRLSIELSIHFVTGSTPFLNKYDFDIKHIKGNEIKLVMHST